MCIDMCLVWLIDDVYYFKLGSYSWLWSLKRLTRICHLCRFWNMKWDCLQIQSTHPFWKSLFTVYPSRRWATGVLAIAPMAFRLSCRRHPESVLYTILNEYWMVFQEHTFIHNLLWSNRRSYTSSDHSRNTAAVRCKPLSAALQQWRSSWWSLPTSLLHRIDLPCDHGKKRLHVCEQVHPMWT